jgi:hypothetical protein
MNTICFIHSYSSKGYPLLTSLGIGYSLSKGDPGFCSFTEGIYKVKGERPNAELAHNSTVPSGRMI